MCYQTWKEEFYSQLTDEIVEKMTPLEAVEHALKKWEGALPENLEKHGVRYKFYRISPDIDTISGLRFDYSTCSLCKKYEDCVGCPLYKYENHQLPNSDYGGCGDRYDKTFYDLSENSPIPMIRALKQTIIMLKKEENGTA